MWKKLHAAVLVAAAGISISASSPLQQAYLDWVKALPVPVIEGYAVEDTRTTPVTEWPLTGGAGAYFHLADNVWLDSAVLEIPPGGKLKLQRVFYEQLVYGLVGNGYTLLQQEGKREEKVEWHEGTMFAPPLNVAYQHVNTDAKKPARLLIFSSFPFMAQVAGDTDFVGKVNAPIRQRYNAQEDYFRLTQRAGNRLWTTNLITDVRTANLDKWDERGKGNSSMFWNMSGNRLMIPHVSEFPVYSYKKGHRHRNEALLYILKGTGYSLVWKEKGDTPVKLPWHEGSLIVAPYFYYHQHFNTGSTPAAYLAITPNALLGVLAHQKMKDEEEGGEVGDQIEYEDEAPQIRVDYEKEIGRTAVLK